MNRVLSWPHTPIVPGLLDPLKHGHIETEVTERHSVQFELPLGPVEMKLLDDEAPLLPGTVVVVWWKTGGFVCAPVDELRAEARQARSVARQLDAVRARMQAARQERQARDSAAAPLDALPPAAPPDHPLLGRDL